MAEILNLTPNYGLQVTYEFSNQVSETYVGNEYVNSQWLNPLATYTFGLAWFEQPVYDYIAGFFNNVSGSQDTFLFLDLLDFEATKDLFFTPYSSATQGVVIEFQGEYQLAKRYQIIHGGGVAFVTRPITRPDDSTVIVYDDLGAPTAITVDPDTGKLIGGGGTDYTWSGQFYVPVRILNDRIPQEIISYDAQNGEQTYRLPDLRLQEVRDGGFPQDKTLFNQLDHYYQLPFEYFNAVDRTSRTDILTTPSGYEGRDSLGTYRRRLTLSESLLDDDKKDYLLTLWRISLGSANNFKWTDTDASMDINARFGSPITFTFISFDKVYGDGTFTCSGLELSQENTEQKSKYCHLWKITKNAQGSQEVGFTDFESPIDYNGLIYYPESTFFAGGSSSTAQLNTDSAELNSYFNPQGFTLDDILSGRLTNARVEYFLYNWDTSTVVSNLMQGDTAGYSIGYLPSGAKEYRLEVFSLDNRLDSSATVETSSTCPYKFLSQGTRQCNRPIDSSVRETATVISATDTDITVSIDASAYVLGTLRFTSGELSSQQEFLIGDVAGSVAKLMYETPLIAQNGDTVELTRFCEKTVAACASYNNQANFGGFPEAPNTDLAITKAEGE